MSRETRTRRTPRGAAVPPGDGSRTVAAVITLKPGVLDAPGQAIRRGLLALGYPVAEVRAGKYFEIILAAGAPTGEAAPAVDEMCRRFLANPLIETWRVEMVPPGDAIAAPGVEARRRPR